MILFFFTGFLTSFLFLGHITVSTNIPKMITALWLLLWISNHSTSSLSRQDKTTLFSVNIFVLYVEKKSYNINTSWRFSKCSRLVLQCMTGVQKFNIYIYTHGPHKNPRRQKGGMQQVPYWGPTNIRRHHTEFRRPGNLVYPKFFIPDVWYPSNWSLVDAWGATRTNEGLLTIYSHCGMSH